MKRIRKRNQAGFTLIELLVVVAIIAVLAALAIPRVRDVIDQSKRTRAQADLKVIAGALERYFSDHGYYPDKLDDLRTGRYVKYDMTFKNVYGKYFFYAVNDNTGGKATAYVLIDPGSSPGDVGDPIQLKQPSQGQPLVAPEGTPPTTTAYAWSTGTSLVSFTYDTTPVPANTTSIGFYCAQAGKTCRTDMVTD